MLFLSLYSILGRLAFNFDELPYCAEPFGALGIKSLSFNGNVNVYFMRDAKGIIHIFRVLYMRREWEDLS